MCSLYRCVEVRSILPIFIAKTHLKSTSDFMLCTARHALPSSVANRVRGEGGLRWLCKSLPAFLFLLPRLTLDVKVPRRQLTIGAGYHNIGSLPQLPKTFYCSLSCNANERQETSFCNNSQETPLHPWVYRKERVRHNHDPPLQHHHD